MHHSHPQELEAATLYVVATPIGNLRDITLRALDVLRTVDVVAAEDTRNTAHLLSHHAIQAPRLLAVHQHNERGAAERIIDLLQAGQRVALVSDAGTPAVSDPGAVLVAQVRVAGYRVVPIPGPSAVTAALSAAGITQAGFLFHGFLPNKPAARRSVLQSLRGIAVPLVFYEAPHRIEACVQDLLEVLGAGREVVLARELSKLFEQIHRCPLEDAPTWLAGDPDRRRGEFVLMVTPAPAAPEGLSAGDELLLACLLAELPLRQAVGLATQIGEGGKKAFYARALEMRAAEPDQDDLGGD